MKSVLMTLFLLTGLGMASLDAQTCTPSPNCSPACIKACLDKSPDGRKARKVSMAACTPEQIAACKAVCTPEQIAACKATMAESGTATPMALLGVVENTPSCRPASTVGAPSCCKGIKAATVADSPRTKHAKVVATKS